MSTLVQLLSVWNHGRYVRKPRLPKGVSWVVRVERLSERFATRSPADLRVG